VRVKDQEGRSIGTEIVPIQGVENCGIDWDKDETIEWKTAECSTGGKEKRFNPLSLSCTLSLSFVENCKRESKPAKAID